MPKSKHNNHPNASEHYRWSHKKILSSEGYVKIRVGKSHPLADPNGYAYEHLLVWISAGDALAENELLHHINDDRQDNRWANLQRMTRAEHNHHHNKIRGRDSLGRFLPKESCWPPAGRGGA